MSLQVTRVVAQPVGESAIPVEIRMRDGVVLATDVYLPAGVKTAPTILVRLPYDKNSRYTFFDRVAERFGARGYVTVVQDVRGKFRSEGETVPFVHEVEDGYDTIDWIVAQAWSDGNVGMFGDSYYGFTQWAAVVSGHPALKAIVPRVTTIDVCSMSKGIGGDGEPVPWLEALHFGVMHWAARESYEYVPDYSRRPFIDGFEDVFAAIGARSAEVDARVSGDPQPDPFGGRDPHASSPIPVLQTVGWFDNLNILHMRDYERLASTPGWAEHQYLEAGAFDHENYRLDLAPVTEADDHAVNDAALERMLDHYTLRPLDFFDVFLRGVGEPALFPRVRWQLGHDGWHEASEWPPPGATTRTLVLTDFAAAVGRSPGGALARGAAAGPEEIRWRYDPESLVPSAAANSFAFLFEYPDERATGDRGDVLTFTSAAVEEPLDLAGPVALDTTVSSTAPTTDVFVKLLDVAPDGSTRMIVRGQVHVPGAHEPRRIRICLGHTGYRVRPGHALRIHIASSDFPVFLPNSGTTENPLTAETLRSSEQTMIASAAVPARLTLTVLAAEA